MTGTVVVTGIGVTAPGGFGLTEFWASVLRGHSSIGPVMRFDARGYPAGLAGEVPAFQVEEHLPSRLVPQTDRVTRLALIAAEWALQDAGHDKESVARFDVGVITASSSGGFEFGERELRNLWSKGGAYVSAYQSFAWFYAVNSGQISIRHGMRGPSGVLVSEQAGGLDALADARRRIRKGSRVILSGGVDASICSWGWVAQLAGGRLSTVADPARAYQPFDAEASGHVPGEGGALLVLEDADSAQDRGARVYGEIAGYGATFDPRPESGREPGLRRAIGLALEDAAVAPDEIDVVFADAAALPELDRIEADAINAVFGRESVPVTAPKTMTGRMLSGSASLDVATALLSIRDSVIPPTVNTAPAQHYGLDVVIGEPRAATVRTALVLARGYGGFNSAMIVRRQPYLSHHVTTERKPRMSVRQLTLDDVRSILRVSGGVEEGVDLDGDIIDVTFEDLGYDSLALLEASTNIERTFGVCLDDPTFRDTATPKALMEVVNSQLVPQDQ